MKIKLVVLCALSVSATRLPAQTGGPGQPEFMQFQQAGTADLVNPSSGTFSYQIAMFIIGGYPINLTYQAGIQMEDVASMTGLGWNLNAGCIVRTLRGLPDDFNGDIITKEFSLKENFTYGGKLDVDLELAGLPDNMSVSVGAGLGVFYNSYKGWGLEPSINGSIGAKLGESVSGSASLGMGISVNSQSGVDKYLSPSVGLKMGNDKNALSVALGKTWAVNSNEGLKERLNVGLSYVRGSQQVRKKNTDPATKDKTKYVYQNIERNGPQPSIGDQSSMPLVGYSNSSYLNNSFQPDIEYPFENSSGTYSGALGFDAYYVDPNIRVTGYYSRQRLATKSQDFSAFGIMYEHPSIGGKSLRDFNTEKKLPYFMGESQILPIPFKTPDVFNLNAQGLSMTFSVNKNDIGVVGDADGTISSTGTQGGAEVNLGQLFKAGANFGTTSSFQQTGRWNPTSLDFEPGQRVFGNQLYQQHYMKNHGEINKFKHTAFDLLGAYQAVQFNVIDESSIGQGLNNGAQITANQLNTIQPVRQSAINYLTAAEAAQIGFDKKIRYYSFNNTAGTVDRVSDYRKAHHLSEVSVVQPDGVKYVFGIPVYNTFQKEVSFNVGPNAFIDCAKNLVRYVAGQDNTVNNNKGIDHFFEATTTPAYATQFLITAVLNPGYSDLTNDGITDDDLGSYVKFSYFKEDFIYNWRTPFGKDQATYSKGLRSDEEDDKGTYVYGQKELYYIRSIESKTEIAEFYYSKRADGYGVRDENGGLNVNHFLRKLDSVVIYSLPDRRKNGNYAIPLKSIHFSFDNSLCPNIDNGNTPATGKLTLKKVDFTYERSRKGKLTPYIFEYGKKSATETINPPYKIRDVNRWGYYQENGSGNYSDCNNSGLSNIDNPYASQNKTEMDRNAYAWNLTDITMPGGGQLKVDYEAHDYAYIQNKVAGQMFKIAGFEESGSVISGNSFHNPATMVTHHRIYFRLYNPINNGNAAMDKNELLENYIKDIREGFLYYKFYVELKAGKYEYITGYARIKDYGVANDPNYAYIELEPVRIDDENNVITCNAIQKASFNFMRINRNSMLHNNNSMNAPGDFASFIQSLPNIQSQLASQVAASAMGVNLYCRTQNYCNQVVLDKSFIRLYNPIRMKIGGGSRVKQISIDDNWDYMTGNTHEGKSYTTSYIYTKQEVDPVSNNKITISSGVADYEPLIGGDEISLKQPIFYSDKKKLAPDNDYYVEEPVNESLFPAPQITYGMVTQITNSTSLNVGKTGKIVNEFFTARDYPVKVSRTPVNEKRDLTKFKPIQNPFVAIDQQHDYVTISQGYSIELNNMSGLPKSTWVYNQNGDRISGEVSAYFPDNDHFTTIDRHGNIHRNTSLGLSSEYTINGKKSYDQSVVTTYNVNLNVSMFGPVPLPLIMPLYSQMTEKKQFQSIVVNNVIHRNALLKSMTVFDQTSSVTTENLAFDEITGEALLSKVSNEFNDTLFSFRYPAWWMYDGMGPAYTNTKLAFNSGNLPAFKQFLKVGDEVRSLANSGRLWVKQNSGSTVFENENGVVQSLSGDYEMYNPAAKNLLSSSAGQVVTWNRNPLINGVRLDFGHSNTLNSSAIEYYVDAVMYCDSCTQLTSRFGKNDFLSGRKGNFRPKRNWFYLEERTPGSLVSGVTNIRTQGLFKNYNDFWKLPAAPSANWTIANTPWEWKERVNLTDVDGQAIETEDRLGRKSANLLGYKNTLITAQAGNAGYGEIYFDGFEDYYAAYCPYQQDRQQQNLSYNNGLMRRVKIISGHLLISNTESHTGKYSLIVPNTLKFTISPPDCKGGGKGTPGPKPVNSKIANGKTAPPIPGQKDAATCDQCIGGFNPEKNKRYIFSCWVKVDKPQPILSNSDASVTITNAAFVSITLHAEGPVIENWQRIEGEFRTSATGNNITILLNRGTATTYFDDLRIYPADGIMASYVYDDVSLRFTYSLDENNYFTKNEYSNQGELIRIKKETEKGIVTIKEGYSSLTKQ